MSTFDEFQKRISKLEAEIAEIMKVLEEIKAMKPKPTLPEAADYEVSPEERIAEEAVEEAYVEETSEEP